MSKAASQRYKEKSVLEGENDWCSLSNKKHIQLIILDEILKVQKI